MNAPWSAQRYVHAIRQADWRTPLGTVATVRGLAVTVTGLNASLGDLCSLEGNLGPVLAEVVGLGQGHITLMPFGRLDGIATGCSVRSQPEQRDIAVGPALLGRVIDAFGQPLDSQPSPQCDARRALAGAPINPMQRPPVNTVLETGVRAIDGLLTLGEGQRVGIFAGSGVGKSTLLGMIARHATADINVIALIGERGREVRDFIERQLGPQGMANTVVVVATADQPAPARVRAAYAAVSIAEHFRDQGKRVLLTMDSITRLAMARREIGLAAGEPPTARGYTPSVFAELPQLCERCGTAASGGAITALLTVLVEGDDMNEPVADALRAILDGHIVLSRAIAERGHYPAIDILKSASRLMAELVTPADRALIRRAVATLSVLERNRQMIDIGAYERGSSAEIDAALAVQAALETFLVQHDAGVNRAEAMAQLRGVLSESR